MPATRPRAIGLLTGYLADRALGDPRRGHPVAGFGAAAAGLETLTYRDSRGAGVLHVAVLLGALAAGGAAAESAAGRRPAGAAAALAAATWVALGGRSLARTGTQLADLLDAGDLDAARGLLPSLCGRDPATLDADGLARAALESVAENTSDAVVAPLFWGGLLGVPGLLGYRAVNTLDAMVGHRNARYERFGWAAARLDDVANWVPARVAAGVTMVAGASRARADAAWRAIRRDAPRHPSPNGGVVEAAFAGVLGRSLGGTNVYGGRAEDRGVLGDGPQATASDIGAAARLSQRVSLGALVVAVGLSGLVQRRR